MLSGQPDRAVVFSADNTYELSVHASGTLAQGTTSTLVWEMAQDDSTGSEMEIWYGGETRCLVELLFLNDKLVAEIRPGTNAHLENAEGRTILYVAHRVKTPGNGDNCIDIYMDAGLSQAGPWKVRLVDVQGPESRFHAWIERDAVPSRFAPPCDPAYTLDTPGCGRLSISVGAYDGYQQDGPICALSSAGPTRDGRSKPEISAPGYNVWAACALCPTELLRMSGTSMAAPMVTGTIALMLAEGRRHTHPMSIQEIREILVQTARKDTRRSDWDPRYGYGRLDALAALEELARRTEEAPVAIAADR